VKWVEDRIENLTATSFARDYHMTTEIAATKEGRVTGLRVHVLADHGAFDACADPSKWPAGFFNIVTGSYDFPVAYLAVDGIYTNKAPGGVAYRCSFRVTEAAYCIERAMDILAQKLGMDPAELRLKNFIKPEQFPYHSALGWEYDSGDYHTAMKKAMETTRYAELRKEQAEKRAAFKRGETRDIMGVGVSFFTEIVGAGPSKNCDILGIAMFDSCEIRKSACTPPGPASRALDRKARDKATKRPGRRSSRPKSGFRPTTSWLRKATRTPRPTGSVPTVRARRRSPAPRSRWRRARSRRRRR
jgi:carbon-monoxide dehydrogenase large subunit